MKKISLFIVALAIIGIAASIPGEKTIPSINLKNVDGTIVNSSTFNNDGKPFVINFWATWCAPCKKELDNIAEVYADWQEETGVKIIAISVDDARTSSRVASTVQAKGWEYEVYVDENADFKRAMNVNLVPHTFLVDASGHVVWEHNNYAEGDEDELFEKIKELTESK